jgi:hypothetical protein
VNLHHLRIFYTLATTGSHRERGHAAVLRAFLALAGQLRR